MKKNNFPQIYLFQEFFKENDELREKEYLFCLKKNIENPSIKKIYLILHPNEFNKDKEYYNIIPKLNSDKVELYIDPTIECEYGKDRCSFQHILYKIVPKIIPPHKYNDVIVAIANLDIFIPDTENWRNIETQFFEITGNKACLALCRTEYINEIYQYREEPAWIRGEFCDCWVFKYPLIVYEEHFPFEVPVGMCPQCDNTMYHVLGEAYKVELINGGYLATVFNWADKFEVYHYDLVRKPNKLNTKYGIMILNDAAVKLPQYFSTRLTPYQDWNSRLGRFIQNKEAFIKVAKKLKIKGK